MTKTLSERIAERSSARAHVRKHVNRSAFIVLKDDIKGALDDGWSVRVIWQTLHAEGRVSFGYDAFARYVEQLIRGPARGMHPSMKSLSPQAIELLKTFETKPDPSRNDLPQPDMPDFRYNATPNKLELL
jgi:hypothetical protein